MLMDLFYDSCPQRNGDAHTLSTQKCRVHLVLFEWKRDNAQRLCVTPDHY